ncbi:restriction endonuclease subunit S [Streptomyces sp. NBC_01221]|uniref:restriction endonuclease subunit S n=1 Tax=Streptomyces sp. NBC_01221 TaxID=2903782 RepID=UPI00225026F0|nr:restriction endonuclease subunit S [Streptomyces sp. NBC_01221]MCX4789635.1 restriction endonuclease subunit S [Streptomyces sp. NBC_01221]
MSVTHKRLGDVASFVRGITFKPTDVVPAGTSSSVWCMRTKNVQAQVDLSDVWSVDSRFVKRSEQYLEEGDVLISSANSWNLVGKCCWIPRLGKPTSFGGFVTALRGDVAQVNRRYLYRWFASARIQEIARSFSRQTTNIANLDLKRCADLSVPLPPLAEQKRIVAVLDRVDALRVKRREAIALLDDLAQSIFLEMFGDYLGRSGDAPEVVALSSVAEIASGITKGRKVPAGELEKVPYLAVANVQDRRLDLSAVKMIEVSATEVERFKLQSDDLLLTEGGDPDKLGRGTLWSNEIPLCLHQNHVFRVRVSDLDRIDPLYLNWVVSSDYGKRYFLRVAKQTTGIASINKTQLGAFPLVVPGLSKQKDFRARVRQVDAQRRVHQTHLATLDELFESVQQRAFAGQLWDHEAA